MKALRRSPDLLAVAIVFLSASLATNSSGFGSVGAMDSAGAPKLPPDSRRPSSPTTPPFDPTTPAAASSPSSSHSTTAPPAAEQGESPARPYDPNSTNAAASSTNPANSGTRPSTAEDESKHREAVAAETTESLSDFTTYDKDRDGRLSLEEFLRASGISSTASTGAAPTRGTDAAGSSGRTQSAAGSTGSSSGESEKSVTEEGAELSLRQMFRRLDNDTDNYVSPSELETYRSNNSTPPPR